MFLGRTGRAGNRGAAYTFFTHDKAKLAGDLIQVMDEANQKVPEELRQMSSGGVRDFL